MNISHEEFSLEINRVKTLMIIDAWFMIIALVPFHYKQILTHLHQSYFYMNYKLRYFCNKYITNI